MNNLNDQGDRLNALCDHLTAQVAAFSQYHKIPIGQEEAASCFAVCCGKAYGAGTEKMRPVILSAACANIMAGMHVDAYEKNRILCAVAVAIAAELKSLSEEDAPFHCSKCAVFLEGERDPEAIDVSCVDCFEIFRGSMIQMGMRAPKASEMQIQVAMKKGPEPDVEN